VGCQVHRGCYLAWVSVVDTVQALLEQQAALYPDYGIVITGHRYLSPHYITPQTLKIQVSVAL